MSELGTRMDLIASALAAMYPRRVVTRHFKDPALRDASQLRDGIYTLLSSGEGQYTNVPGYSAQEGHQSIVLVADIDAGGSVDEPATVEDAEFEMIDEIKGFVRTLPASLCTMNLMSWTQSGQIAAPRGWVVFQLEYVP